MPFEFLFDGFMRKFTPVTPLDWMSVIEFEGTPLPLIVFVGDKTIADRTDPLNPRTTVGGMPTVTGVDKMLHPRDPSLLEYADYVPFEDPPGSGLFPKFIALFVEGLNPTDDPARPNWGFSTGLDPHDLGPLEVVYPAVVYPDAPVGQQGRLGEAALIKQLVLLVHQQLDATWARWYAREPATVAADGSPAKVIDPTRIFVVGQGRAATLALELLNDLPTDRFTFAGAAIVVGRAGGTLGGFQIADVLGLGAPGQFRVVNTPAPPSPNKAILAICGDGAHLGNPTDQASVVGADPSVPSATDLAANGLDATLPYPNEVDELVREEINVFATLNRWAAALGSGPFVVNATLTEFNAALATVYDSSALFSGNYRIRVVSAPGVGDDWPTQALIGEEGILAIYRFFANFVP